MPTIIDSLFVELGLDPSKFTKGQKEAVDSFEKTKAQAKKTADEIEESGAQAARFFTVLKREALSLFSAYLTAKGLKDFIVNTTVANAEAGRMAKTLNMSVRDLSMWQIAVKMSGGTAEGVTSTLQSLTSEIQKFSLTGEAGNAITYFRSLGMSIVDANGQFKDAGQLLLELSQRVDGMDPARAAEFLRGIGADQGTINLLVRGQAAVRKYLEQAREAGTITKHQADEADHLTHAWERFSAAAQTVGRVLVDGISMPIEGVLSLATQGLEHPFNSLLSIMAPGAAGVKALKAKQDAEQYIRESAAKRGIDPDVAVQVARNEGLSKYTGDSGSSFGPYQLHYGGIAGGGNAVSGLGDVFTKQTGLDAKDPATTKQQIDFALDYAKEHGWGSWHGWQGLPFEGIQPGAMPTLGAAGSGGSVDSSVRTSDVRIGTLVIQTQATDATGIARDIGPALERNGIATQANYGAN